MARTKKPSTDHGRSPKKPTEVSLAPEEQRVYELYERVVDVLQVRCKPPIVFEDESQNEGGRYDSSEKQIYVSRALLQSDGNFISGFLKYLGQQEAGADQYARWCQEAAAIVFLQWDGSERERLNDRKIADGLKRVLSEGLYASRSRAESLNSSLRQIQEDNGQLRAELAREREKSLTERVRERIIGAIPEGMQEARAQIRKYVAETDSLESAKRFIEYRIVPDLLVLDASVSTHAKSVRDRAREDFASTVKSIQSGPLAKLREAGRATLGYVTGAPQAVINYVENSVIPDAIVVDASIQDYAKRLKKE